MNYTDSTDETIKQLEEKVAFLERCISKLEQKIWSGSGLVDRIEKLEEENNRLINWKNNFRERIEKIEQELWKKNVERDHVEYDFIGQMDKTAREIGEYLEGEKDESDR